MSKLSPAAQAVLDTSTSVYWRPIIDVPTFQQKSIAAALRAAADQLAYEDAEGRKFIYVPELLTIATELETQ
jgi:hypothetical protein